MIRVSLEVIASQLIPKNNTIYLFYLFLAQLLYVYLYSILTHHSSAFVVAKILYNFICPSVLSEFNYLPFQIDGWFLLRRFPLQMNIYLDRLSGYKILKEFFFISSFISFFLWSYSFVYPLYSNSLTTILDVNVFVIY